MNINCATDGDSVNNPTDHSLHGKGHDFFSSIPGLIFYPENLVLPRIAGSSMGHVVDPAKRESEIDGSASEFCV